MALENKEKSENAAETSSQQVISKINTPKSLKAKPKISKNSSNSNVKKTLTLKGVPVVQKKKIKKKKPEGNKERVEAVDENPSLGEEKQKSIAEENHNEKSKQKHNTKERIGAMQKKQTNKKHNEKRGGLDKKEKSQKNEDEHARSEKNQQKEKNKEKLGGLIFMCSAKTKPDCFRYRVMGVTMNRKETVLSVKPGLMLFLYDFDLRLMYGIYEASSAGGIKLEPRAFDGAFPVQVRFNVQKDCYPLPESVFKKAILDNYNEKNKFSLELTVKQVKQLMKLFRPAEVHSVNPSIRPERMARIEDREVFERAEEPPLRSKRSSRDHDAYDHQLRRYAHENNQRLEVPLKEREELPRDPFLSEKEYRTYGLRRGRPNPNPPLTNIAPALEPHSRGGYVRDNDLLRQPPAALEPIPRDPLLLSEAEYQAYGLAGRREPQLPISSTVYPTYTSSHYATSSLGTTYPHSRNDELYSLGGSRGTYLAESDDLRRRESYLIEPVTVDRRGTYLSEPVQNDDRDKLYSSYASTALSDYNRVHKPHDATHDATLAPVSSRYSFAGPSMSYR